MHEDIHGKPPSWGTGAPSDWKATAWPLALMAAATEKSPRAVPWLLTLIRWWSPASGPGTGRRSGQRATADRQRRRRAWRPPGGRGGGTSNHGRTHDRLQAVNHQPGRPIPHRRARPSAVAARRHLPTAPGQRSRSRPRAPCVWWKAVREDRSPVLVLALAPRQDWSCSWRPGWVGFRSAPSAVVPASARPATLA